LILGSSIVLLSIVTMFLVNKILKKKENVLLKDPETIYEVKLIEKEILTKDTRRFRFALENPEQRLGLPVGQHVHILENLNGSEVRRSYTPTTSDDTKGYFELVIKVYFKDVHPKFPNGGKMTQHLESLKIGDKIKVRGPAGKIQYKGKGKFAIKKENKGEPIMYEFNKLGLVAGGSGITPMYQLMQAITNNPEDKTEVHLLFANQSEDDILLRKEIEEMAAKHPDQIKFWYTIDRSSGDSWQYSTGFINEEMVREHLPPAHDKTAILFCGPLIMGTAAVKPNLDKLSHKEENYFKY